MLLESTLHGPGLVAAAPVSTEAFPSSTPTQKGAAPGAIEAAEKAPPPRAVAIRLLLPALYLVLERVGVPVVAGAAPLEAEDGPLAALKASWRTIFHVHRRRHRTTRDHSRSCVATSCLYLSAPI